MKPGKQKPNIPHSEGRRRGNKQLAAIKTSAGFPRIMERSVLQVLCSVWSADPLFPVKQEEANERRLKFKVEHSW